MQAQNSGFVGIFLIQTLFLLLYVLFVRYDRALLPLDENADLDDVNLQHRANYPRKFCHFIDVERDYTAEMVALIFTQFMSAYVWHRKSALCAV